MKRRRALALLKRACTLTLALGMTSGAASAASHDALHDVYGYFSYMMNVREITALEQKLKDIRYKALFISAERIEYERINNITERVKEHGLQLVPASQPPYLLLDTGQCGRPSPQDLPEANR